MILMAIYLFIGLLLAKPMFKLADKTIEREEAGPFFINLAPLLCIFCWPIMIPIMLVVNHKFNKLRKSPPSMARMRIQWYENALKCTELALDALDRGDMASYQLFVRLSELRCNLLETDEFVSVSSPKIKKLPYKSDHYRKIDAVLSRNLN